MYEVIILYKEDFEFDYINIIYYDITYISIYYDTLHCTICTIDKKIV